MRKAIVTELKTITDFSDRVYQAFLAPTTVITPYCTVKMGEDMPVVGNIKGAFQHFEVYIYITPSSFITLDSLVLKVRKALHNITLSTDESPTRFFRPEFDRTLNDWKDDINNLLMKTCYFNIPLARA